MRGIDIESDVMSEILTSKVWKNQGMDLKLKETSEPEAEAEPVVEEAQEEEEGHSCPLCDSRLEEAISDERLQQHVDYMLDVLDEANKSEGETLEEEVEKTDEQ